MTITRGSTTLDEVVSSLRGRGACFAYLHGSRARGEARPDSDTDVAAWFGRTDVHAWEIELPEGVDLLVLDAAPLELAGRVATEGVLLFEDDVAERVRWEAVTRTIWFDERPRVERSHREFLESLADG